MRLGKILAFSLAKHEVGKKTLRQTYTTRRYGRTCISIQEVLNNNRWVRHILPLTSEIEIREYVGQWEIISQTPTRPQEYA